MNPTLQHLIASALRFAALVPDRDRDIVFYDLETTGFDGKTCDLLEMSGVRLRPDGSAASWQQFYKPRAPITKEITELTNITDADVADAPEWDTWAAHIVLAALHGCDLGGFNSKSFDNCFLQDASARVGVAFDPASWGARNVDAYKLWMAVEKRNLATFVERFAKRSHEGAHRADADTLGTTDGLVGFLECFPDVPRTVQGLNDLAFPVDKNRVDEEGKFVWDARGHAVCNFGINRGKPVALLDQGFWKWVLRSNFRPDVHAIARNAITGALPKRDR